MASLRWIVGSAIGALATFASPTVAQLASGAHAKQCSDAPIIGARVYRPACAQPNDYSFTLSLNTSALLSQVDPRFLSVTFDAAAVPNHFDAMPWSTPGLQEMCGALQPTMVRFGGAQADFLVYDFNASANAKSESNQLHGASSRSSTPATMLASDFASFLAFLGSISWELVFTLNELTQRQSDGGWNTQPAEQLMEFVRDQSKGSGVTLVGWQLGTTPDLYSTLAPSAAISPPQLIADTIALQSLLSKQTDPRQQPPPMLVGWEVKGLEDDHGYFSALLAQPNGVGLLNATTLQHTYTPLNQSDPLASMLSPAMLDQLDDFLTSAATLVSSFSPSPSLPFWLSLNTLPDGGVHGVTDRFASGFVWMDALGTAAAHGVQILFRETLRASETTTPPLSAGLLTSNILPTPDLFTSFLYKRLMGTKILRVTAVNTTKDDEGPNGEMVRVYASCTPSAVAFPSDSPSAQSSSAAGTGGSVTLMFLNLNTDASVALQGVGAWGGSRIEYRLSGSEISSDWRVTLASRHLALNGQTLVSQCNGSLPHMPGAPTDNSQPFVIEPITYGFVVFPQAQEPLCGFQDEDQQHEGIAFA